jgi:hypothetical protein
MRKKLEKISPNNIFQFSKAIQCGNRRGDGSVIKFKNELKKFHQANTCEQPLQMFNPTQQKE